VAVFYIGGLILQHHSIKSPVGCASRLRYCGRYSALWLNNKAMTHKQKRSHNAIFY